MQYTVWSCGVKQLRGVVVHQHGCGEGSCKSGQTGAFDLHWQALAKKHDCALLAFIRATAKGRLPVVRSAQSQQGFSGGAVELGKLSGHAELATVHGRSGVIRRRTLGRRHGDAASRARPPLAALRRAFCGQSRSAHHQAAHLPKAALGVPMMCNPAPRKASPSRPAASPACGP